MANTTFLELTNRILRKLNEVELNEETFDSVRGVHAAVKDAVNDSIDELNKVAWEWPFNAYEHTEVLSIGAEEYAWPIQVSFKAVDWESFQIQKDVALDVNSHYLKPINRHEWYQVLRDRDDDSGAPGLHRPEFVFPTHGRGYAVSPSPDKEYTIRFRYYKHPERLVNQDDITTCPPEFDYIIQQGALYNMYLFLDNDERSTVCERKFNDGIKAMRRLLVPEDFYATSGVMNPGGQFAHWSRGPWMVR